MMVSSGANAWLYIQKKSDCCRPLRPPYFKTDCQTEKPAQRLNKKKERKGICKKEIETDHPPTRRLYCSSTSILSYFKSSHKRKNKVRRNTRT